ncbi:hypothetical protein BSKO_05303 [Bryopsis sp. KO-2023]|nr:hypothetical protein BSKO_05303 [Bryopsis sp. KO-2023]
MEGEATDTPLSSQGYLEVKEVEYTSEAKGRGVFAVKPIPRGALVEVAHCILFPKQEYDDHLRHTAMEHYLFGKTDDMMLPLGFGALFNHSRSPNLDYRLDMPNLIIRYYACKDVSPGSELFIYYGGDLWFDEGLEASDD